MKRINNSIFAALMAVLLLCGCGAQTPATEVKPLSGMEIMEEMKLGWNLGNSFDAPEGETAWDNPVTPPELMQAVKDLGFDSVRIPVSWGKHVSAAPEYKIDEVFINRVDEVVTQALDAGLYVILDVHHDNYIYTPTPENADHGAEYLNAVWLQIAEHFKDADQHLIFQTMNEPRVEGTSYEWGLSPTKKSHQEILQVVNRLNQTALDAIRSTGGKNADRYVMVCPYAGKFDSTINLFFKMPEDTAENRLILSVHNYSPYNLCMNLDPKLSSFSPSDMKSVESELANIDRQFLRRGIPVIIDEMGCTNKNNPDARQAWATAFREIAEGYQLPIVVWDNGYLFSDGDNFGLIDRLDGSVYAESACIYSGLFGSVG